MSNEILNIELLQRLSIDEVINLYKQGYRLSESIDNLYEELSLPSLSPATCPTTAISQNTTKDITVTVSGGQPNYVYKLYKGPSGGTLSLWQQYPVTGNIADTSHVFTGMAFSDSPGTYTIKGEATDSCSPTAQVQSDQCNITISAPTCPTPIASITYPVCPLTIQQGAVRTITVALTGGTGSPPYTYKLFMDGTEINSTDTTRTTSNTTYSFGHTFSESVATHTLTVTITNSCVPPNTSLVANCSVIIQSLPVTTGSLSITSNVDGATVEVDGTVRGTTATGIPVVVSNLSAGSHPVKVSKTGYTTWQQNKTVVTGETTAVDAVLTQPGVGGGSAAILLFAALAGIGLVYMKGGK